METVSKVSAGNHANGNASARQTDMALQYLQTMLDEQKAKADTGRWLAKVVATPGLHAKNKSFGQEDVAAEASPVPARASSCVALQERDRSSPTIRHYSAAVVQTGEPDSPRSVKVLSVAAGVPPEMPFGPRSQSATRRMSMPTLQSTSPLRGIAEQRIVDVQIPAPLYPVPPAWPPPNRLSTSPSRVQVAPAVDIAPVVPFGQSAGTPFASTASLPRCPSPEARSQVSAAPAPWSWQQGQQGQHSNSFPPSDAAGPVLPESLATNGNAAVQQASADSPRSPCISGVATFPAISNGTTSSPCLQTGTAPPPTLAAAAAAAFCAGGSNPVAGRAGSPRGGVVLGGPTRPHGWSFTQGEKESSFASGGTGMCPRSATSPPRYTGGPPAGASAAVAAAAYAAVAAATPAALAAMASAAQPLGTQKAMACPVDRVPQNRATSPPLTVGGPGLLPSQAPTSPSGTRLASPGQPWRWGVGGQAPPQVSPRRQSPGGPSPGNCMQQDVTSSVSLACAASGSLAGAASPQPRTWRWSGDGRGPAQAGSTQVAGPPAVGSTCQANSPPRSPVLQQHRQLPSPGADASKYRTRTPPRVRMGPSDNGTNMLPAQPKRPLPAVQAGGARSSLRNSNSGLSAIPSAASATATCRAPPPQTQRGKPVFSPRKPGGFFQESPRRQFRV